MEIPSCDVKSINKHVVLVDNSTFIFRCTSHVSMLAVDIINLLITDSQKSIVVFETHVQSYMWSKRNENEITIVSLELELDHMSSASH